jgi:hypothetical protein
MVSKFVTFIRQLPGCLLLYLLSSCTEVRSNELPPIMEDNSRPAAYLRNAWNRINNLKQKVVSGSIITRTGTDFTSQTFKSFNQRDKTFSHCGIASIENDSIFVYHAIGGEFNPDQKIKREYFDYFADPGSNNRLGLYIFDFKTLSPTLLVKEARRLYKRDIKFDMDFDLRTDDRMYCAEYVAKCLSMASGNKVNPRVSVQGSMKFIGVDDIYLTKGCKKLCSIDYK